MNKYIFSARGSKRRNSDPFWQSTIWNNYNWRTIRVKKLSSNS